MKCWQSHRYDISPGISDVHDSVSWLPGKEIATGCYVNTTIDQTKRHVNAYFAYNTSGLTPPSPI